MADESRSELSSKWKQVVDFLKQDDDITGRQRGFVYSSKAEAQAGDTLIIAVPSELARKVLEDNLAGKLHNAVTQVFGDSANLVFRIDTSMNVTAPEDDSNQQTTHDPVAPTPIAHAAKDEDDQRYGRLNKKYTFESFIIGGSNRWAHATALAVAEAPAASYNPLFVYGDSGLGKTHLLHAIGNEAKKLHKGIRVKYASAEEFTNDFINSIRGDDPASFKDIYRNVDILLIDDIQFLATREATIEEFFHTYNALYNDSKQIVITSDLSPRKLTGFETRLTSRFESGMSIEVSPPELETRIAILRKKAASEGLTAPESVLEFIASKVSTNVRELEGALIRVSAFASLNEQPVDVPLAELVLKDLILDNDGSQITAAQILGQTAAYFNLTLEDLLSKSRTRTLVTARQIAMYLCREMTEMSLPKVGQEVGGRDHTTVMHAEKRIRELMAEKPTVFNQVAELTARIRQNSRNS